MSQQTVKGLQGSGSLPHIPSDPAWKVIWEADFKLQASFNNIEQNNILKVKEGMIDEIRSNFITKIDYTIFFSWQNMFYFVQNTSGL